MVQAMSSESEDKAKQQAMIVQKERAIEQNYRAFKKLLPALIEQHPDKFALMRDEVPIAFYDTARDAYIAGLDKFADGLFSVQEITARKIHLGWFSHAAHNPSA
ncbi:MAG: hypothetical protein GKS02_11760 [Alphaproteobacteria bacterium]|nr:hypothetical protein [Alphaproteobacteria bacterium]